MPTPIVFNSVKPKTPTIRLPAKIGKKKAKKEEKVIAVKEKIVKAEAPKKTRKVKLKNVEKIEIKQVLILNAKKVKEFGKSIRKKNLKCKMKRFTPETPWGIDEKKVIEETKLRRAAELISTCKVKLLAQKKKPLKKVVKRRKPSKSAAKSAYIASCAVKIQAHIRGFLTRKAFKNFMEKQVVDFSSHMRSSNIAIEDYPDEDEEVRNIIKYEHSESNPFISILNSEEILKSLYDPLIREEFKHNRNIEHVLTSQISWRLKQQLKLQELKENDIFEMQNIAENFQNRDGLLGVFRNIIERRYEKLNAFFEDHIESMKIGLMSKRSSENFERQGVDLFFNSSQEIKQSSGELGEDIEKIWQQIETFEHAGENNSFLQDPQPLPPLTPIYEEGRYDSFVFTPETSVVFHEYSSENHALAEPLQEFFPGTPCYIEKSNPFKKADSVILDSTEDLKEPEPWKSTSSELPIIHVICDSSSMTLEHSEALKDYSSIILTPVSEKNDDLSSLEYELDLKPNETAKKSISSNLQMFEMDSPSNPFSVTVEKSLDNSEENIVTERVTSLLELIIYHDILNDNIDIFQDVEHTMRIIEDYFEKLIAAFINEATRPVVILNLYGGSVNTDGGSLLRYIDHLFLGALKEPDVITRKILNLRDPLALLQDLQDNKKIQYNGEIIFEEEKDEHSINNFEEIHNKMLIKACSESLISISHQGTSNLFNFHSRLPKNYKLADLLLTVREEIFKWNEIKSGTIPMGEILRANGDLDEDKLLFLRNKALARALYLELDENEKKWSDYRYEEATALLDLEKIIFSELSQEIIQILSE